jgi:hypothetical protein
VDPRPFVREKIGFGGRVGRGQGLPHPPHRCRVIRDKTYDKGSTLSSAFIGGAASKTPPPRRRVASSLSSCRLLLVVVSSGSKKNGCARSKNRACVGSGVCGTAANEPMRVRVTSGTAVDEGENEGGDKGDLASSSSSYLRVASSSLSHRRGAKKIGTLALAAEQQKIRRALGRRGPGRPRLLLLVAAGSQ